MEYALCVVVGFLLCVLFGNAPKRQKWKSKPTQEEVRRAEKAMREYKNFMSYDGFSSQGEENE